MQHPLDDTWTALIDDRYALRRMIGRGGMGEVWLADDLVLRRVVAVKLLHTQLTLDTGRQPFTGDSPFAIAYQHVCADPQAPGDLGVQLPPHVQAVLTRAMAKNPDDRFADATAMHEALVAHRSHGFAPPQDTTLPQAPTFPEEPATTVLRTSKESHGPQRTALAALALLGAGAVTAAVLTAAPDATHAIGPGPQPSPSSSASPSTGPEPSTRGSEGTTRPNSGAGPMSPRASTEPTTPTVVVPGNLVGRTLAQASADLAELNLNIALTPRSSGIGSSTVTATIPSAGTQLSPGDTVLLATRADTETPADATPTSGSEGSDRRASAPPTTAGTDPVFRQHRPPFHH